MIHAILCALGIHGWFPETEYDAKLALARWDAAREVRYVCRHCNLVTHFAFVERLKHPVAR